MVTVSDTSTHELDLIALGRLERNQCLERSQECHRDKDGPATE
jgi:hypothetical protein